MNIEDFREKCISMPGVSESFPFDNDTLVFKVMGKLFALVSLEKASSANLKCEPEKAIDLREHFESVQPGYHMNKQHWNTVFFDGDVPDKLFDELIKESYQLVVSGLTKKLKEELKQITIA
jgi:predicted DNA-binding protein (MmcQ/YjbR family)